MVILLTLYGTVSVSVKFLTNDTAKSMEILI